MRRLALVWTVLITLAATSSPVAAETSHVVISQLQVAGTTANDEWIELYNPTVSPVDLSTFSLQYKSATGSTFQKKNFPSGATIAAHGYYLAAHNDSGVAGTADMVHSSFSMAGAGGNIFLVNTTTLLPNPTDASIVDRIGYGTGDAPEGSAAAAPASGQSLQRLPADAQGNGTDTDNNATDFVPNPSPTARGSQSPIQPAIPTSSSDTSSTSSTSSTTTATDSSTSNTRSTTTSTTSTEANASATSSATTSSETSTTTSASSSNAATSTETTTTQSSSESSNAPSNQSSTSASSESSNDTSTTTSSATSTASSADTAHSSEATNTAAQSAPLASVVRLNEILPRPESGGNEWIELYFSGDPFSITGWTIEDGKGVISTLDATPTNRWFVVELTSAHLNNDGDTVILRDATSAMIDRMTYGSFDDGNALDNASTPGQGATLNRYPDGKDTEADNIDWYVSTSATKGSTNQVVAPPPPASTVSSRGQSPNSSATVMPNVMINEFVSDPADGDTEWIELINKETVAVSLNGWTIEDGSGSMTTITGVIGASDADRYYLVTSPKGSLNNSGDHIVLKNENRQIVDEVRFGDWGDSESTNAPVARDPWSVARVVDGYRSGSLKKDFAVTTTPTPRGRNTVVAPNNSPPTRSSAKSPNAANAPTTNKAGSAPLLLINEVLPNPIGADRGHEWIELVNRSPAAIELPRLIIEVRGGARTNITPFRLAGSTLMALSETIPPLPNSGATIRLLVEEKDAKGRITEKELDRVAYPPASTEGQSYALSSEGRWQWTTTPTVGIANAIADPNHAPVAQFWIAPTAAQGEILLFDASDSYDPDRQPITYHWAFSDGTTLDGMAVEKIMPAQKRLTATLTVSDGITSGSVHDTIALASPEAHSDTSQQTGAAATRATAKTGAVQTVTLSEINELERNTAVIASGVVSATPATFGGSAFALSGSGTLVKLSGRHKWPTLSVGDRVQIHGKISVTQTGTAIRVNDPSDVAIQAHGIAPSPTTMAIADVVDRETNDLVTITASIRDVRTKSWLVEDEESEIAVIPPVGLPRIPQPQEQVRITGVIEHTTTSNRLRARTIDDVAFLSAPAPTETTTIPLQKNSQLPTMVFTGILAGSLLLLIIREPVAPGPQWPTPEPELKPVVASNGILQLPNSFQTEEERQ
ncbi:lamin tail domain-containing protein [Candidatus Uhrbacteria bacterium]|nr:lamin tail domain-containing protein [Candidatus Uhrbacteria bacterium]